MIDIINDIKEIGLKHYPTPGTKHGFSVKKLADLLKLNDSTLLKWLDGKTAPTERQQEHLKEYVWIWGESNPEHIVPKNLVKEMDESYGIEHYKKLYLKEKERADKAEIELKECLNAKNELKGELLEEINNLRKRLDKFPK